MSGLVSLSSRTLHTISVYHTKFAVATHTGIAFNSQYVQMHVPREQRGGQFIRKLIWLWRVFVNLFHIRCDLQHPNIRRILTLFARSDYARLYTLVCVFLKKNKIIFRVSDLL